MGIADELAKGVLGLGFDLALDAHRKSKFTAQIGETGEILFCDECTAREVGDYYFREGFVGVTPAAIFVAAQAKQSLKKVSLAIPRNAVFSVKEGKVLFRTIYWFVIRQTGREYEISIPQRLAFMKLLGPSSFDGWDKFPALRAAFD